MALVNSAFTVNVTPGAMPPTVHVSEYDTGRTYTVTINGQNGSAFNIPSGTTATVEGTLNGVIGFTTGATISGSNVSFTLTESMTARSGKAWCKIKLTLNNEPIQTCAFILAVDRAGVEADTVIGAPGFEEQIQDAVDNYLEEHPVPTVTVDPTLTISGAAADAKMTGDKVSAVQSALSKTYDFTDFYSGDLPTANVGAVQDFALLEQDPDWRNAIIKCKAGETFTINGKGGNGVRLWSFLDANKVVLSRANSGVSASGLVLTAESDGWFVYNSTAAAAVGVSIYCEQFYSLQEMNAEIDEIDDKLSTVYTKNSALFAIRNFNTEMPSVSVPVYNPTAFVPLSTIYQRYDALLAAYPNWITKTVLGKDESGEFDILRYDFTPESLGIVQTNPWADYVTPYTSDDYPTVVMDFGIHGSERPCVLAGLNFFEQLAADFEKDTPFGWLRRNVKFSVIPVSNPWGYVNNQRVNFNHVDLNRNFPIDWNRGGTSDSTSEQYRGSAALSEKETQYISAMLNEYQNKAVAYFNWHTFGNWSSWKLTCFSFADCEADKMLKAAIQTAERMSVNAWQNHAVNSSGEYITIAQMEVRGDGGLSDKYGASLGIPSSCSECLYKLYDGTTGSVYDTTTNAMNTEFIALCVQSALQTLLP